MKRSVIVDTNVAIVANGKTPQASPDCVISCIRELKEVRRNRLVLLDETGYILREYRQHLSHKGQPGVGDAFFKWLHDNQGNPRYCKRIAVTPLNEDGTDFAEFPDDPELKGFDFSDRKFVATALASNEAPLVLNASDTDWWHCRELLERHRVTVQFICPELMGK